VIRFLPSVAQSIAIILTALIAKRLGGDRIAQWIAALATAVAPVSLAASALYQYVTFDYLWWVLIAYCVASLIETNDERWWMAIGAAIGLAVLTKYTIAFFIAGLAVGFFASGMQRHLRSRWFWIGVAIAFALALPHFIWEARHDFISLDFLKSIHKRDVRIGRADHFLIEQLFIPASPVTIPLWIAGLVALFSSKRFRILGWMAVVPFVLFVIAHGRSYYTAPLYPMLFAAGATIVPHRARAFAIALIAIVGVAGAPFVLPLAPINSPLFEVAAKANEDFVEEIGWPDLVNEVARIWSTIPASEQSRTGIFANNYGEAGAIDLYGPAHGLPPVICNTNSYWLRGPGNPPPQTLIVLGDHREGLEKHCHSVTLAGHTPNPYNIKNEETHDHPDIFICRGLKETWPELWPKIRNFG
jgi:4-amino-4-deoxy-L-arabinose transferase-like glycosyltransferase